MILSLVGSVFLVRSVQKRVFQLNNRFRTFDFWDGAIFGITVSSICGMGLAWLLSEKDPEMLGVLATLTAIPLAFFAAFISFFIVRYQINSARRQDSAASRVVLPLALTRMMEVSNNAILLASGQHTSPPTTREGFRELLSLDDTLLQTIRDNVRTADPITQRWMAVMVARYQVYFARIDSWWNEPTPTHSAAGVTSFSYSREDAILDWATFFALVEHHYDYARNVAIDSVGEKLDVSRIRSALFLNIFHVTFDPGFEQRITIRVDRLSSGKVEKFEFY